MQNELMLDIQNIANPAFPIPADCEVQDATSNTIAETTQKYLDAITDADIINAITPYIKDKIDKVIFDIGVFLIFKDAVIPEKEVTWQSLTNVLQQAQFDLR